MRADVDAPAHAWRPPFKTFVLIAVLALVLGVLVFATPFNHDEDQYLAASALASKARLYCDFLYVQTPLQPELTAPLTGLAPGWSFLVLRLVSAGCGVAALVAVWVAQRRLGVGRAMADVSVLLMASCYTFQFCSSVARNDALPMALAAWAIAAAAAALSPQARRPWLDWALCGLLFGAATSAKVSFAPLLGAAAAYVGVRLARAPSRARWLEAGGLAMGGLAGLSPIALAWAAAPEATRFALVGFWSDGPRRWYVANGLAHRMAPASKLLYGLGDLALGPALATIAVIVFSGLRSRKSRVGDRAGAGFFDLMILAALVAAFAPSPTYKQYFAPLMAPLFVRLGLDFTAGRRPLWTKAALALGGLTGLVVLGLTIGRAVSTDRWTPLRVAREDRWIGDTLRRAGVSGAVATLSAHTVLDSGFPLDRRFAGGAMVYRSADGVDAGLRRRLHITSPSTLARDLEAQPPVALVTGYEGPGGDTRVDLDGGLRAYALARNYTVHRYPGGGTQLYIRPAEVSRATR